MFLKEIFSKKTNSLKESFHKKLLNIGVYEKSYIRGGAFFDESTIRVSDDNTGFSNSYKNKVNRYNEKNSYLKTSKKENRSIFAQGHSLHSQNFLYKNRKNENFRFHSSVLKSSQCKNYLDTLCQSIKTLKSTNVHDSNSLLILAPRRGGFSCYASGLLGFLPKKHGSSLFYKTLFSLAGSKKSDKRLDNILLITRPREFLSYHFLLRLQFFAGKFCLVFRKRRKRFSSSRKKNKGNTHRRYTMTFLSRPNNL
jgi:hypothetical protein